MKFLKTSNVTFALALLVLGGTVYYGINQYNIFQNEKQAIVDNQIRVQEKAEVLEKSKQEFKAFAEERAKKQNDLTKRISAILPPNENYTELTRQLDDYFAEHDTAGNPVFQSSLRFGKGTAVAGITGVSGLPFSMNLEGTRDNFFKFLNFVNQSGSVEKGGRLMDILSIQMNFPEGGESVNDLKQKINFTVDMNAYYQTPKVAR